MYVNETQASYPTLHAEYDPEGYVHYLFGIAYENDFDSFSDGMRQLSTDIGGGEFEVFVNYGPVSLRFLSLHTYLLNVSFFTPNARAIFRAINHFNRNMKRYESEKGIRL